MDEVWELTATWTSALPNSEGLFSSPEKAQEFGNGMAEVRGIESLDWEQYPDGQYYAEAETRTGDLLRLWVTEREIDPIHY